MERDKFEMRDKVVLRRMNTEKMKLDEFNNKPGIELEDRSIDEMPDCLEKYRRILEMRKDDLSYRFVDTQFNHDETSLGGELDNLDVIWKRVSNFKGAKLFQEGDDEDVTHTDI